MKLYLRECRRIGTSLVYLLFVAMLIFSWWGKFHGVTKTEIDWANGKAPANFSLDRPLLVQPTKEDDDFGMKISEDHPDEIMTGTTRALWMEYKKNVYATYPLPLRNYKAVSLSGKEQAHVLDILCEITGLTEEQLSNLPQNYFPAVTGTIISFNATDFDEDGNLHMSGQSDETGQGVETDKTKKFISQVSYERFKQLMREMEAILGEEGSQYSTDMMVTYFGMSEMSYEEACAEYQSTIKEDKVTGGFARLFCDYIGLSLGIYPIFIIVYLYLKDRSDHMTELISIRSISSPMLVVSRYFASITMVFIPVILLSFESLIPLVSFGREHGISIDYFAYLKYMAWWLLPVVMVVTAIGTFCTLLTDSPVAVLLQFLCWIIDKGATGLSGDINITTLMIRHNTLRGYELIQDHFSAICWNRLLMAGISILLIIASAWILQQKRKGRINAANIYEKFLGYYKNKFSVIHTK